MVWSSYIQGSRAWINWLRSPHGQLRQTAAGKRELVKNYRRIFKRRRHERLVKPSRRLHEARVGMGEGFALSSRSLCSPRSLHEALVKSQRTLRDGATATPLRECFMKPP